MPNRILRDWTDSESVNGLDWPCEVFFTRLIMKVDDFGRFTANPKLLRSLLFPLKDGIRETDISRHLAACEKAGLIVLYKVADKSFLEIRNFKQRTRQEVSKFPAPTDSNVGQTTVVRQADAHGDVFVDGDEDVNNPDPVPHEEFQQAWNGLGQPFSQIAKWSDGRRKALATRWTDKMFREQWQIALKRMSESAFCRGSNKQGWIADVEFFLRPNTIVKIMEGKYGGGGKEQKSKEYREREERRRVIEAKQWLELNGHGGEVPV